MTVVPLCTTRYFLVHVGNKMCRFEYMFPGMRGAEHFACGARVKIRRAGKKARKLADSRGKS